MRLVAPHDAPSLAPAAVKGDIASLTARLDALHGYVVRKRSDGAAASAGGEAPDPTLATPQGMSHGDAIVGSLKAQLLRFTGALRGALQQRTVVMRSVADRRSGLGLASARDLGRPLSITPAVVTADHGHGGAEVVIDVAAASTAAASSNSHRRVTSRPADTLGLQRGAGARTAADWLDAMDERGRPTSEAASLLAPSRTGGETAAGGGRDSAGSDAPFAMLATAQLEGGTEGAIAAARAADVATIERHVSDISTLFTRLTAVVAEQGVAVDRIEDQVASSEMHVDRGHQQLQRYSAAVSSRGRLIASISAVLIVFIILMVLFFL